MTASEPLIPKHGGYRKLKSFQVAQLVYDVTVRFCDRYIDKRSRTHDQMVQAARSGVQNIAEGSQASGTSTKTELKLTNVARASLEELRLDYEDFLRQRGMPIWDRDDPRRQELIDCRCATADEVAAWVREEYDRGRGGQSGLRGQERPSATSARSTQSTFAELAANAALVHEGYTRETMTGWAVRRVGYLRVFEAAYALAIFVALQEGDATAAAAHLNTDARAYFKAALKDLRRRWQTALAELRALSPRANPEGTGR
jgi:four helix bundle protein